MFQAALDHICGLEPSLEVGMAEEGLEQVGATPRREVRQGCMAPSSTVTTHTTTRRRTSLTLLAAGYGPSSSHTSHTGPDKRDRSWTARSPVLLSTEPGPSMGISHTQAQRQLLVVSPHLWRGSRCFEARPDPAVRSGLPQDGTLANTGKGCANDCPNPNPKGAR